MKIVLDTNVLISGIFWPNGIPAKILDCWGNNQFDVVASEEILKEYEQIIVRTAKKRKKEELIDLTLSFVYSRIILVAPKRLYSKVCDDPSDVKFIEAAVGGKISTIVTGDKALLRAHIPELKILKPQEFYKIT